MNKLSIQLVTWNSEKYILNALKSLEEQTFKDFSVIIIDNASMDNTVSVIKECAPYASVVQSNKNNGFSKGNNQAIGYTKSEYICLMNPDVILSPQCIERLMGSISSDNTIGSVTGKTYKLYGDPRHLNNLSFSKVIDSAGINVYRSRRFTERGAGEHDSEQYNKQEEVFGVGGALAIYRREALDDIRINNEYFDEDMLAYKEDIDCAWRLRLREWKSYYVPDAVAYHHRAVGGKEKETDFETAKNRLQKPSYAHRISYQNHLCMLVKNEQKKHFVKDVIFILWYEVKKIGFILLFEQKTLIALFQFLKLLPKMLRKRHIIQKRATVKAEEMRKWLA